MSDTLDEQEDSFGFSDINIIKPITYDLIDGENDDDLSEEEPEGDLEGDHPENFNPFIIGPDNDNDNDDGESFNNIEPSEDDQQYEDDCESLIENLNKDG